MNKKHPRDQPRGHVVTSNFRMNSEARKVLKSEAALRDRSMEDLFHELICNAFDRPDLIDRPPSSLTRGSVKVVPEPAPA